MARNAYQRQTVRCPSCEWEGVRKDTAKPCPKCGAAIEGAGLAGRAIDDRLKRKPKSYARTFGQDLMRGEHVVGTNRSKTLRAPKGQKPALRGGTDPYREGAESAQTGTSIFDPVLCEMGYRWFCPPGGLILDPFAGGSVRGIVASRLGRNYVGVDLRPEQLAANRAQAATICEGFPTPEWVHGDSRQIIPGLDIEADLIFSCPPYGDLEVYSDLEADLSTMDHEGFVEAYRSIIAAAVDKLKEDRFAIFVVGDYRDEAGFYRNFCGITVNAFEAAGARLYNWGILVTAAGSLAMRTGKQFAATRKFGKSHQDILVFCKGDPKKATEAVGEVEFGDIEPGPGDGATSGDEGLPGGSPYGEIL